MRSWTLSMLPCFLAASVTAQAAFVDGLCAKGRLGIPLAQARELEARLRQLFFIDVDGFGYSGPLALSPAYVELAKRLQVGGGHPHCGNTNYERIRRANRMP